MPYKPPVPYARRILHFCESRGIEVPVGFHNRSAYKFAVVDQSAGKLIAATWARESQVIEYLKLATADGRTFQIFDFKHGREMQYVGGARLHRGETFQHRTPSETSAV